jgi:hypothetical protein
MRVEVWSRMVGVRLTTPEGQHLPIKLRLQTDVLLTAAVQSGPGMARAEHGCMKQMHMNDACHIRVVDV